VKLGRGWCRAAVYFEMGKYDDCIADCDTAVDKARELRADYKVIGKALTRKGNALVKKGDLEAALTTYQKALTEHRYAPVAVSQSHAAVLARARPRVCICGGVVAFLV
jgi:tetratricopeptide (TPR) repeat protein